LEVADRDAVGPHVAGHAHALDDARRERRGANRARRPVEHRSVRGAAAGEVMTLDHALEALAAAGADDVHALPVGEDADVDLVAQLRRLAARFHAHFTPHARGSGTGLLEVAGRGLVFLRRL